MRGMYGVVAMAMVLLAMGTADAQTTPPQVIAGVTRMLFDLQAPVVPANAYFLCVDSVPADGLCRTPLTVDALTAQPVFTLPFTVPNGDHDLIVQAASEGGRVTGDPTRFRVVGAPSKPINLRKQ